jgi:hypothetical protein
MSRRLETRLRAAEEHLERKYPTPRDTSFSDFASRYPGTTHLWSDIAMVWMALRPRPRLLDAAAAADPRIARALVRMAAVIRREDAARGGGPYPVPGCESGRTPAELAAAERNALAGAARVLAFADASPGGARSPGVTAAEAAASRQRATALAGGFVELAGRIGAGTP